MPDSRVLEELAEGVLAGKIPRVARAITWAESADSRFPRLLARLFPHTGRARVTGLTGSPGAGKSTLTAALARKARAAGRKVGIVAVDPSSPFSGGAILGDRIRMQDLYTDPGVLIRSMATRGHLGGLARATADAVDVLDAAGYDDILVETVGVGQDEVEVFRLAESCVVVLTPGMGDDIQAIKAGLMEVADLFVVNKADRDDAVRAVTVGLVHDEEVRDLHEARLDGLNVVAHAGRQDDHAALGEPEDLDLVLAHAHRLDEDLVVPGGVEHVHGVGRRARETAEMAARRHRPDEHAGIRVKVLHADSVAENRAARERRRRVHGDDADLSPEDARLARERGGQRGLARSRRAGQARHTGAARSRKNERKKRAKARIVSFGPCDRARDGGHAAREDAFGEILDRPGDRHLRSVVDREATSALRPPRPS